MKELQSCLLTAGWKFCTMHTSVAPADMTHTGQSAWLRLLSCTTGPISGGPAELRATAVSTRRTRLQPLEQAEERGGLAYAGELDAEALHLQQQLLHADQVVAYEALQEHAHQAHGPVLHVLVLRPSPGVCFLSSSASGRAGARRTAALRQEAMQLEM